MDVVVTNPGAVSATLTGGYTYVPVAIVSIVPAGATTVTIHGTGFPAGAIATFDGIPATENRINGAFLVARVPSHAVGPVDIAVTNPGGQSAMLERGFTYEVSARTVTPTSVAPGGQFTVTWAIANPVSSLDWIGLFKAGDPNTSCISYEYTDRRPTGTVTFIAPPQPGQYDFRYLLDDGYEDVARSETGTVTAAPMSEGGMAHRSGGRLAPRKQ